MTPTPTADDTLEAPHPTTIAPTHADSAPARPLPSTRSRRLTVSYLPAVWPAYTPHPDPLPYLRLRGRWLQEAGFVVGAKIRVRVEPQRLILELESDQPPGSLATSASVHEPQVVS